VVVNNRPIEIGGPVPRKMRLAGRKRLSETPGPPTEGKVATLLVRLTAVVDGLATLEGDVERLRAELERRGQAVNVTLPVMASVLSATVLLERLTQMAIAAMVEES